MSEPIDILENKLLQDEPGLLEVLLSDHTTRKNIFWATDSYADYGEGYEWHDSITVEAITGKHGNIIMPRAMKSRDEQLRRSRQMAEVFTPSWLVGKMNDVIDEEWTGLHEELNENKNAWQDYVLATRLEITCGEAPFLTSRYDTVSGEPIPIAGRTGILDRKLRMVNDNSSDEEWAHWALLALGSVYGYEWQGDNLLLAREALLATFNEYYEQHFGKRADKATIFRAAEIISWNVWQMDGLKAVVPCSCHDDQHTESDLFGEQTTTVTPCPGCDKNDILLHNGLRCRLRRWIPSIDDMPDYFECLYLDFITKKYKTHHKTKWPMKFDFVIGNPPYQEEKEDNGRQPPIYDKFMDGTYQVSDKVLLISPARFLFNAGQTPKEWNKKMLCDPHLKVLMYEQDSSKVFPNTDIKGGVVVTYRNANTNFGEIGSFTTYNELNSITKKVESNKSFSKGAFANLISPRGMYRFTNDFFEENPKILKGRSKGTGNMITSNSFDLFPDIFTIDKPESTEEYIQVFGRVRNQRVYRWIKKRYVIINDFLEKYNVIVPEANGTGAIGEVLSTPLIGVTDTFISIGKFDKETCAKACLKYVKTKFARTMLGILKATQHNPKPTWKYVPLQDFTSSSDIDWSKSVHEIDVQLYDKYGLTAEECQFIETHVKEMD
jgi:type II restriction endonuclease